MKKCEDNQNFHQDIGRFFVEGSQVFLDGFDQVKDLMYISISARQVYVVPGVCFKMDYFHYQFFVEKDSRSIKSLMLSELLIINDLVGTRYDYLDGRYLCYDHETPILF